MALNYKTSTDETYNIQCASKIVIPNSEGEDVTYAIKDMTSRKHISTTEAALEETSITDLASRVSTLENNTSSAYDDSAIVKRIENLEKKEDKDTIYNDSAIIKRLEALEKKEDKDTVYDDTKITEEVKLLKDTVDKLSTKARMYDTALGITDTATLRDSLIIETKSSSGISTSNDRKPRVYDVSKSTRYGTAMGAALVEKTKGNNIFNYIGHANSLGNQVFIIDVDNEGYNTLNTVAVSQILESVQNVLTAYKAIPIASPYLLGEFSVREDTSIEYGQEPALWNSGIAYSKDFKAATAADIISLLSINNNSMFIGATDIDSDSSDITTYNIVTVSEDGILSVFDVNTKMLTPLVQFALISDELKVVEYIQDKAIVEEKLQLLNNGSAIMAFSLRYSYFDNYSEIKVTVNTTLLKALGIDFPQNTNLIYTYKHNKSGGFLGIGGNYNNWSGSSSNPRF